MMVGHFEGSLTENAQHGTGKEDIKGDRSQVTIDLLPDVALLVVFDFYVEEERWDCPWYRLVHVCQKWRNIIFGSPRRLNLRLYCKATTPVRKALDVWPPFPIVIRVPSMRYPDNIMVALEHIDRIYELSLVDIRRWQLEKVLATMQQPFPALTCLHLLSSHELPVIPDSFLGGSAPRLQTVFLACIPFPGLPKLLLSATHLVTLNLWRIPGSGYISPEAMVAGLSVSTRLKNLTIEFESPQSRPDQNTRRPPPRTRTLLPVLTKLRFIGIGEYFEDLVARVDAPLLDNLSIIIRKPIFDTPQFTQLISRTPKLKAYDDAHGILSKFRRDGCLSIKI